MHKYRHSCMCYVHFTDSSRLMRAAGGPQALNSRKTGTFCSLSTPYPEVSPAWDGKLSQPHPLVKAQWLFPSSATDNSHKAIGPKAGENCDVPDSQLVLCSQLVGSGRLAIMICDGPCRTLFRKLKWERSRSLFLLLRKCLVIFFYCAKGLWLYWLNFQVTL